MVNEEHRLRNASDSETKVGQMFSSLIKFTNCRQSDSEDQTCLLL